MIYNRLQLILEVTNSPGAPKVLGSNLTGRLFFPKKLSAYLPYCRNVLKSFHIIVDSSVLIYLCCL